MPIVLRQSNTGEIAACLQKNNYDLDYYGVKQWETEEEAEAQKESFLHAIGRDDAPYWLVLSIDENRVKLCNVKLKKRSVTNTAVKLGRRDDDPAALNTQAGQDGNGEGNLLNQTNPFNIFEQASTDQELQQFRQTVVEGGFTAFRLFLEGFRDMLKRFEDGEIERVNRCLPQPGSCFPSRDGSASWVDIWNEFEQIAQFKQTVLESIVGDDRAGEWQILIDNPYTNTDLACYPSLTFLEGAYLSRISAPT